MIVLQILAYSWLIMAGAFACAASLTRPRRLEYWAPAFVLFISSMMLFLIADRI